VGAEHTGSGTALLLGQGQQDVLGGDIFILHGVGLGLGLVQHRVQSLADIYLPGTGSGDLGEFLEVPLDLFGHQEFIDTHLLEQCGNGSLRLLQQRCQEMLHLHLLVIAGTCQSLCLRQSFLALDG